MHQFVGKGGNPYRRSCQFWVRADRNGRKRQRKTTFVTNNALFRNTRMQFGLPIPSATFQLSMGLILGTIKLHYVSVDIDDVNIFSTLPSDRTEHSEVVLKLIH